jgi:hypothetical protein
MPTRRRKSLVGLLAGTCLVIGALIAFRDGEERAMRKAAPRAVAQLWIDKSGGTCRRSPEPRPYRDGAACSSFTAAYDAAEQGDTVMVKGGTYRDAELGGTVKGDPDADEADVGFRAAPGETVDIHDIEVVVPHITFRDIDLLEAAFKYRSDFDAQRAGDITVVGSDGHSMTVTSVWNFTLRDSDIGPNRHPGQPGDETQDGIFVGAYPVDDGHHPKNMLIENVTFHDVVRPLETSHSDCLQLTAGENVRITRSSFERCADADIIPKNDQGPIADLVIENNVLGEVVNASEEINFHDTGRPCGDVTIRNNSVLGTIRIDGGVPGTDCRLVVTGNIAASMSPSRCSNSQAEVLEHNVWESGTPCGDTNIVVADGDVDYVDRAELNLNLRPTSEAIDHGDPARHSVVDHDGRRRADSAPDAGAYERQHD